MVEPLQGLEMCATLSFGVNLQNFVVEQLQ